MNRLQCLILEQNFVQTSSEEKFLKKFPNFTLTIDIILYVTLIQTLTGYRSFGRCLSWLIFSIPSSIFFLFTLGRKNRHWTFCTITFGDFLISRSWTFCFRWWISLCFINFLERIIESHENWLENWLKKSIPNEEKNRNKYAGNTNHL